MPSPEILLTARADAPAPTLPADREAERRDMVAQHMEARGVADARVLAAMRAVPRHCFALAEYASFAYHDHPLPIGEEQTISQPYIVAFMTEQLQLTPDSRVLEIGAGCGYQTAVLSLLAREVVTLEIVAPLARRAAETLSRLGFANVTLLLGNGTAGYPDAAPYDAIIVTAAAPGSVDALLGQLAVGGRMVAPIGPAGQTQQLTLFIRESADRIHAQKLLPVRFVPLTGA